MSDKVATMMIVRSLEAILEELKAMRHELQQLNERASRQESFEQRATYTHER
jgi:hypothetical protein